MIVCLSPEPGTRGKTKKAAVKYDSLFLAISCPRINTPDSFLYDYTVVKDATTSMYLPFSLSYPDSFVSREYKQLPR